MVCSITFTIHEFFMVVGHKNNSCKVEWKRYKITITVLKTAIYSASILHILKTSCLDIACDCFKQCFTLSLCLHIGVV